MTGFGPHEPDRTPRVPPPARTARRRKGRPWWRRLLSTVLVLGLVLVGVVVVAFVLFGAPVVVEPGAWVEVRFSPTYPDARPDRSGLRSALQPIDLSHQEVLAALRRVEADERVQGILLRPEGFAGGWAQANELRDALGRVRAQGKRVVAHANGLSTIDVHLASAAERTTLAPEGVLLLGGVQAELVFLRRALDKLGVEVESVGVGEYKSAPEQFTADGSSPASRRQVEALLDDVYGAWTRTLADARGMTATRVSMLIERGLFDAGQALETGLVDAVEDVEATLQDLGDPPVLGVLDYLTAAGEDPRADDGSRIAVIHVTGTIVPGPSQDGGLGGALAGSDTIVERLQRAREDDRVRAVVLRIDSPGGSALASDLILREVDRVRAVKPVVASMGNTAASGGYYVAMRADQIVADPLTVTGSIGVFVLRPNFAGTYEKLDVTVESYGRGPNVGLFDTSRPWTPGQRAVMQETLDRFYARFVAAVADGRGMSVDDAEAVAGGRVWSGRRALDAGLVDRLGVRRDAIALAAELGGVDRAVVPRVVTFQPEPGLLDRALSNLFANEIRAGGWLTTVQPWVDVVSTSAELRAMADGAPQFAMPWRLRFR